MALATCPSRDDLQAFSDGALATELHEEVAQHLETCSACQAVLETLPPAAASWAAALAQPVAADPFQEEAECQAAVARYETVLPEAAQESPAPDLGMLGHYQLLARLGQGGMGT